jgi:quercetin dioxygenase-like cupin family protein
MPEPRVIRAKETVSRELDPQGRRSAQLLRQMIGGKDVGINYGEWEPGASNGPHTRTKDEMIFALHGKGEVIVEGGKAYTLEPYTFIHIPAGVTHTHRNAGNGVYIQISFAPDGPYTQP